MFRKTPALNIVLKLSSFKHDWIYRLLTSRRQHLFVLLCTCMRRENTQPSLMCLTPGLDPTAPWWLVAVHLNIYRSESIHASENSQSETVTINCPIKSNFFPPHLFGYNWIFIETKLIYSLDDCCSCVFESNAKPAGAGRDRCAHTVQRVLSPPIPHPIILRHDLLLASCSASRAV